MKYLYFRDVRSPDPKDTIALPWGGVIPKLNAAQSSHSGGDGNQRSPQYNVLYAVLRKTPPPPKQPVWPFHYVGTWLPVFLSSATALLKRKIRRARC